MDPETRRALNAINLAFYDARAESFSTTRDHAWPGWRRLLPRLAEMRPLRVLDVGCGNARLAHFLHDHGITLDYTGVDSSAPLLEIARQALPGARLIPQDLVLDDASALPEGPFDLVALFGVTHHIPGEAFRHSLLRALAQRVAPGGLLVFTTWQFGSDDRFAGRSLPFDAEALDTAQLEPGDQLLQWGDDPKSRRYCHATPEDELERLVDSIPLECVERYEADGRGDRLNRYCVFRRSA